MDRSALNVGFWDAEDGAERAPVRDYLCSKVSTKDVEEFCTVILDETLHKASRRLIATALSWMADSGETSFPLTGTVRLSLAQWQQMHAAIAAADLAQGATA